MRTTDAMWSGEDVSPGEIEAALRALAAECHAARDGFAPARALNLVCVLDAGHSGEIADRLSQVGRYHGSRTIMCAVQAGRETIDARVTLAFEGEPTAGPLVGVRETVVLTIGERHLPSLNTIVDPLVVTDLATVAWAPHGHAAAIDGLTAGGGTQIAQVVLIDSAAAAEPLIHPGAAIGPRDGSATPGLAWAAEVAAGAYVVDLAWLRCTPWRERLAAAFDPPAHRDELDRVAKVSVRHGRDSTTSGLLLLGWLCARLGWTAVPLRREGTLLCGSALADSAEVQLRLDAVELEVPGLEGVELTTRDGALLALQRGTGGLHARRRGPDGGERAWTILGASRGEGGILGEGIRQALLRDPTHRPALDAAVRLAA